MLKLTNWGSGLMLLLADDDNPAEIIVVLLQTGIGKTNDMLPGSQRRGERSGLTALHRTERFANGVKLRRFQMSKNIGVGGADDGSIITDQLSPGPFAIWACWKRDRMLEIFTAAAKTPTQRVEAGSKMARSCRNVVSLGEIVEQYTADFDSPFPSAYAACQSGSCAREALFCF